MTETNVDKIAIDTTKVVNELISIRSKTQPEVKDSLHSILSKSSDIFNIISDCQKDFLVDETRPLDFYYNTMDLLTGVYMYLSPIVSILTAIEKNRSLNFYHSSKIEIDKAGGKFTSAPVEREADNFVSEERYILSVFEGYIEATRQGIMTCRSRIKEQKEELDLNK